MTIAKTNNRLGLTAIIYSCREETPEFDEPLASRHIESRRCGRPFQTRSPVLLARGELATVHGRVGPRGSLHWIKVGICFGSQYEGPRSRVVVGDSNEPSWPGAGAICNVRKD